MQQTKDKAELKRQEQDKAFTLECGRVIFHVTMRMLVLVNRSKTMIMRLLEKKGEARLLHSFAAKYCFLSHFISHCSLTKAELCVGAVGGGMMLIPSNADVWSAAGILPAWCPLAFFFSFCVPPVR